MAQKRAANPETCFQTLILKLQGFWAGLRAPLDRSGGVFAPAPR